MGKKGEFRGFLGSKKYFSEPMLGSLNQPIRRLLNFLGMTKRRVMKRRVILESYDFGELCVNHAQTTPTFTNDHTQFLNYLDVFLN